ncbi:MAG: hypothetical protein D6683_04815 [Actinomyces sp.]|nr:MAG: hypothetical protein D6683_04815 [Actinomyces sp.]
MAEAPDTECEPLDIAGIVVGVTGPEPCRRVVRRRFGSTRRPGAAPEIRLDLGDEPDPVPGGEPDAVVQNIAVWEPRDAGAATVFAAHRTTARVAGTEVRVGGPVETPVDRTAFDMVCQCAVGVAVASPRRALVHAAVVARGRGAVLVVGGSGRGKSTAAVAAFASGWELCGDDLAVVERDADAWVVTAVRRPVAVPAEVLVGLPGADSAVVVEGDDPARARRALPLEILAAGRRRLAAVVVAGHDAGDGRVEPLGAGSLDPVVGALATIPTPGILRRHLAVLSGLAGLPSFRLSHAADPDRRRRRAGAMLDEIAAAVGLDPGAAGLQSGEAGQ